MVARILSTSEVAQAFRVARNTVTSWITRGLIDSYKNPSSGAKNTGLHIRFEDALSFAVKNKLPTDILESLAGDFCPAVLIVAENGDLARVMEKYFDVANCESCLQAGLRLRARMFEAAILDTCQLTRGEVAELCGWFADVSPATVIVRMVDEDCPKGATIAEEHLLWRRPFDAQVAAKGLWKRLRGK